MKKFSVTHATLYGCIAAELDFAEKHNRYAQDCVRQLSESLYGNHEGIISSLKFNQHQRDIYVERAAAMLELCGLFNPNDQTANLETLNSIRKDMEYWLYANKD